jgi:hypothetical protein
MLRSSNTPGTRSDRLWPNARPKRPSTPRRIRRNSKRSKVRAENLDAMEFRIFATCLSELRDDVPQWRSYASDGRGVALGFDFESIQMLRVSLFSSHSDRRPRPCASNSFRNKYTGGLHVGCFLGQGWGTAMRHVKLPSVMKYGRSSNYAAPTMSAPFRNECTTAYTGSPFSLATSLSSSTRASRANKSGGSPFQSISRQPVRRS